MLQQPKRIFKLVIASLLLIAGFFCCRLTLLSPAAASNSSDAIAVRILSNPNHLSALEWYNKQGFSGSPQSITVDGYEGVRDGRTVYVDVANIIAGASTDDLYTNIYLISYNQTAAQETTDIFAEMLSHWKFNSNIVKSGFCRSSTSTVCDLDEDCKLGDFCDSPKARVIRDVRRLSDLHDIKQAIDNYYSSKGSYPKLNSGTYLVHRTYSVWPSWKDELAKSIGTSLAVDPVNKIGDCPGYNSATCWNENTLKFATNIPDLPKNSLLYSYYYYDTSPKPSYDVCAVFESGLKFEGAQVCSIAVCLDFDHDGYGSPGSTKCTYSQLDCNDSNPNIGPATAGTCSDCDGFIHCNDPLCSTNSACTGNTSLCNHNGICETAAGEDCNTCPSDCGSCSSTCVPNCSTSPGCLPSLTNGSVLPTGSCCGGDQCYTCANNYTWNGSACVYDCSKTNDPLCVNLSSTGCSTDQTQRWDCETDANGCVTRVLYNCLGYTHCSAATHQCVSSCPVDANCNPPTPPYLGYDPSTAVGCGSSATLPYDWHYIWNCKPSGSCYVTNWTLCPSCTSGTPTCDPSATPLPKCTCASIACTQTCGLCLSAIPTHGSSTSGVCCGTGGESCYACDSGYTWNSTLSACEANCTDTCTSLGYQCGPQTVCGNPTNCGTCTSGICCGSTCQTPACTSNTDCDDSNSCTTDTCNNAGTCTAACTYTAKTCGVNGDGCCPSGCTAATDSDCTDTTAPTITITYPTTSSYSTSSAIVVVRGTATDDVKVTGMTCTNSSGGSCTVVNTGISWSTWSISDLTLSAGNNVVTVTGVDAAGNAGTATVTIIYNPGCNFVITFPCTF